MKKLGEGRLVSLEERLEYGENCKRVEERIREKVERRDLEEEKRREVEYLFKGLCYRVGGEMKRCVREKDLEGLGDLLWEFVMSGYLLGKE